MRVCRSNASPNAASPDLPIERVPPVFIDCADQFGKFDLDVLELCRHRFNVGRRVPAMLWRDFGMLPARAAPHDECRSRTIKTPPFTVREQVSLLARVDGVSEQLGNLIGLRKALAPFRFDQLDHQLRTSPRAPLIGALLTEAGLSRDRILQPRDPPALERGVREHHPRERDRVWRNLSRIREENDVRAESQSPAMAVQAKLRTLIPIRTCIRADSAADRADHARPEGGHCHAIGKTARVQRCAW
jgi:hypothetical protein